jgi:hypothetical protein
MVRVLAAFMAAVLVAAWAPAASAALFFTFSRTSASPGQPVTVRTAGDGALALIPSDSPPLRVFLVRDDDIDAIASPDDARLISLGELNVDSDGNGTLTFDVPDVPAGSYRTLVHCVGCAPHSAGREIAPTGPFEVPFMVLSDPDARRDSSRRIVLASVALAALLATTAWAFRRQRLR